MDRELLIRIMDDNVRLAARKRIYPRDIFLEPKGNHVLSGVRRSGKSTILQGEIQRLLKAGVPASSIVYLNFDDERLAFMHREELDDILMAEARRSSDPDGAIFFLDELQNIEGWANFARRLADEGRRVYITGSNARMLSREFEGVLGGRYLIHEVFPYSYEEALRAAGIPDGKDTLAMGKREKFLSSFLQWGGFPESLSYVDKRGYLGSLYGKILIGDIVERHEVRRPQVLRLMARKLAESVGEPLYLSRFRGILSSLGANVNAQTASDYLSFLEEGYLTFSVPCGIGSFQEKEGARKRYFVDNGILSLFLEGARGDSALLENMVAIALRRKAGEGSLRFLRGRSGREVDFYWPERSLLVQCAWSLSSPEAFEREVKGLLAFKDIVKEDSRLLIVTREEKGLIERDGVRIEVVPLGEFLNSPL